MNAEEKRRSVEEHVGDRVDPLQLSIDPRETVTDVRGVPVVGVLQGEQRQLACAGEIAGAVLVVDRERLGGKPA
jgi:hypothetical protein